MLPTAVAIPEFRKPAETVSPSVHNLLHDAVYVEGGIQYAAYKPLNACRFTLIFLIFVSIEHYLVNTRPHIRERNFTYFFYSGSVGINEDV